MPRITTNFIYNVALTLSTYLINLLLFPYVSRVLGVDLVGKVGFVNETISYFSLFAILGIATVGIREIAACAESITAFMENCRALCDDEALRCNRIAFFDDFCQVCGRIIQLD